MRKNKTGAPPKKGVSEKMRRLSDRIPLSPETKHAVRTASEIGGHLGSLFAAPEESGSSIGIIGILGHLVTLVTLGTRWVLGGRTPPTPKTMKSIRRGPCKKTHT